MAKRSAGRYGLGLACFAAVAVAMAGATQFTVGGGSNGWSVPPAGAESLNAWAMKNRFQVGDKLVFVYPSDQDSLLLVAPSDYNACNTSSYVKKFTDGVTTFTLDHSGAFFFISGVEANCRANEKLIVMVLAAGRNGTGGAPAPSTTPPASSPPPAPTTAPPPSSPPPASPNAPPPSSPAPMPPTTRVTAACRSCSHDAFCFVVIAPCCYSTVDPAICAGRCLAGRPLLAHPVRERDDDGHKAACR